MAGDVVQFIEYLPDIHNTNPEFSPRHIKPDVPVCHCDASTQKLEAGGSEAHTVSQKAAGLHERPCLKKIKDKI